MAATLETIECLTYVHTNCVNLLVTTHNHAGHCYGHKAGDDYGECSFIVKWRIPGRSPKNIVDGINSPSSPASSQYPTQHVPITLWMKMPTPESEMFLSKKPKVAPTFDGVDYDDDKAFKAAQDAILKEQWVQSMMCRLIGEELGKCYRREGVNHLEKCGHLRDRYFEQLKHAKIRGYLWQQRNYVPKTEESADT